jgi:hypothetical protein
MVVVVTLRKCSGRGTVTPYGATCFGDIAMRHATDMYERILANQGNSMFSQYTHPMRVTSDGCIRSWRLWRNLKAERKHTSSGGGHQQRDKIPRPKTHHTSRAWLYLYPSALRHHCARSPYTLIIATWTRLITTSLVVRRSAQAPTGTHPLSLTPNNNHSASYRGTLYLIVGMRLLE